MNGALEPGARGEMRIGARVGPYEIRDKLGEGGMGEVFRARDTKLEREVAIKMLPEAFVEDAERLARFEREAKLLAQLNHPNIAHIYGLEASGDSHALVMELVEGPTLADRLAQGPLSVEESLTIARQIAEALEEAHGKGIVHRDLKPQNLKASAEGKVKVLDFGLAKAMDPTAAVSGASSQLAASPTLTLGATVQGVILGTAAYMSPEQAKGQAVDKRADVWAFGVVLYEMLTGARLFAGDTVPETLAGVLKSEIDLATLPAETPPSVRRLLRRCLERHPKNRLHDIADVRIEIDDVLAGREEAAAPAAAAPVAGRAAGWRAIALGCALGVALGVAAGRWTAGPGKAVAPPEPPELRALTYSGRSWDPIVSPDGRTVAFTSDRDGTVRVWLLQIDSGEEVALTPGGFPVFSPDGATLLVRRSLEVFRIPVIGGTARKIARAGAATWLGGEGQIVLWRAGGERTGFYLVDSDGGQEKLLLEGREFGGWLTASPDGTRLAFSRTAGFNTASFALALLDPATGDIRDLTTLPAGSDLGGLAWDGDDALIYAWSPTGATGRGAQLLRLPIGGGEPRPLFSFASLPGRISLAGRGALVYTTYTQRQNLFRAGDGAGSERPLTRGPVIDRQPAFSPDGQRIVFTSDRSGNFDLWALELAGGGLRRLTFDPADDWDPQWSPDGRHLLWSSNRGGHYEIWIADADGQGARQVTADGVDAENPTMSADGEWIVYSTSNPAGPGIWKIRADGTDAQQLLAGNYVLPELSPATGWVAAVHGGGRSVGRTPVRVVRLEDGAPVATVSIPATDSNTGRSRWLPDGKTLVVYAGEQGQTWLYRAQIEPGRDSLPDPKPLLTGEKESALESFAISPVDGTLVVSRLYEEGDITLAEGIPGIGESLPERKR